MKLDELTDKLYENGIGKAKTEAEAILAEARSKADQIIAEAEKKSEEMAARSRSDAENMKKQTASEISLASEQALSTLKSNIRELLIQSVIGDSVNEAVKDSGFIKKLILAIAEKWDPEKASLDLSVILPAADQKDFVNYFESKAKAILDKGLEIKASEKVKTGFQIAPKDGSYKISFNEEAFNQFFLSFLRGKAQEVLFPRG